VHVHGGVQRGRAALIGDIRVGAGLDEQRRKLVVRVDDRDDERRGAVGIG
jgi:hypothetical protein